VVLDAGLRTRRVFVGGEEVRIRPAA